MGVLVRDAPDAARSQLAADVERLRKRFEAELLESERGSRSVIDRSNHGL
jgi:hypothetical protein